MAFMAALSFSYGVMPAAFASMLSLIGLMRQLLAQILAPFTVAEGQRGPEDRRPAVLTESQIKEVSQSLLHADYSCVVYSCMKDASLPLSYCRLATQAACFHSQFSAS